MASAALDISGNYWCSSFRKNNKCRKRSETQEPTFLSALFVFPDPLALSAELFSSTDTDTDSALQLYPTL